MWALCPRLSWEGPVGICGDLNTGRGLELWQDVHVHTKNGHRHGLKSQPECTQTNKCSHIMHINQSVAHAVYLWCLSTSAVNWRLWRLSIQIALLFSWTARLSSAQWLNFTRWNNSRCELSFLLNKLPMPRSPAEEVYEMSFYRYFVHIILSQDGGMYGVLKEWMALVCPICVWQSVVGFCPLHCSGIGLCDSHFC